MCGFIGCFHEKVEKRDSLFRELFEDMNNIIIHRGPDDTGYFYDDEISFGFRRLSIIDIESGHQPMTYENERFWIIFNGEIYNHVELRNELVEQGFQFETNSDTEVILALYSVQKEKTP